jgi:histidyl-tRNA synthetase
MLTIAHTNCASTGELLDRTLDTLEFYGFDPLDRVLKERKPARAVRPLGTPKLAHSTERRLAAATKSFVAHGFNRHSRPRFVYRVEGGVSKTSALNLHVIGSHSAIAESMLIAMLAAFARDSGLNNYVMHINSIGDRESSARFVRELTHYLRSHLNTMPSYARDDMQAGNPMRAFTRLVEKGSEIVSGAPSPMEFLNDESRAHLRSVLEYTENMGIPYELDTTVLGSNDCWQHTTFELRTPNENGGAIVVARGGRHNTLAQKSFRVDLPVVSAVIEHEIHGRTRPKRRTQKEPKFFFAQLGPQAKMKSFVVLENLREAGVPIRQQIAIESIGSQLKQAEEKGIPYTVIIGHKEALENTAIVRNMRSRSQVVIPLANLPGYLKRLRVS